MNKTNLTTFFFMSSCIIIVSCSKEKKTEITSPLPKITHYEWGKINIDNHPFKDCRIWLQNYEEWVWEKTGTRHVPGIQIADLEDFVDQVDVIILSEGMDGVLRTKHETLEYLTSKQKEFSQLRTPQAIELYNKLAAEGKRVGALLHSTC